MDHPQALVADPAPPQDAADAVRSRATPDLSPEHAEALLELLFRSAGAGVALFDTELRFVRVNAHMAGLDGLPVETHLGRTPDETLPFDAPKVEAALRQVLSSGQAVTCIRLSGDAPDAPGVARHFAASCHPLCVAGELRGVLAVVHETTGQRRAEAALLEQTAMLQPLVENIGQTFYLDDPATGRTLYVSPAYEQMFGRSADSLYADPRSFLHAIHPDDRPRVEAALPRVRTGQLDLRYRVLRPDGTVRWVRDRSVPVHDAGGRLVRSAGIVEDVTLEHELLESQRLLAEAGRVLSASLDVRETLDRALELLVPRLGDLAFVALRGGDGRLEARAWRTAVPELAPALDESLRGWSEDEAGDSFSSQVLRTGAAQLCELGPAHVRAAAPDAGRARHWLEVSPTSAVGVPLAARGEVFGVLVVGMAARTGRRHSEREYQAVREIGERAALALDNARLYAAEQAARAAAEAAAERIRRLQALTAALSQATTPAEVARAALRQGLAALGGVAGGVAMLDADGQTLEMVASEELAPGQAEGNGWTRFPLGAPLAASQAVRAQEMIVVGSLDEWRARWPAVGPGLQALGVEAGVVVPLRVENRAVGVLAFNFHERRHFSPDDLAFITAVARQAAQAMERARLFAAEHEARGAAERAADRARRLQQVTAALSHAATPRQVAEVIVRNGAAAMDAQAVSLAQVDLASGEFHVLASAGYADPVAQAYERFPLQPGRPLSEAVLRRQLVVAESVEAAAERFPEMAGALRATGYEAYAGVPVVAGGRPLGGLSFSWSEPRAFTGDDRSFLATLAELAAQAMERSELYEAERRARAEAEAANRAKTEFLAVMSHELRTPLNAIAGYAELLAMGIRGPVTPAQAEDLARIQRSQRHLLGLINDVLNFARIEAGRVELDLRDVVLDGALAEVEPLVAPQVMERGLVYRYAGTDPGLVARADPEKLRQVLLNVLSNAVKFTPAGGTVAMDAVAGPDGTVRVRVTDTGIGIPADRLESIFEPFVQLGRSLSSRHEGTGLGLAISRDLARGMGGDLSAASAPGQGSTFTLTLPRVGAQSSPGPATD